MTDRATATPKQVAHSFASEFGRGRELKFDGHAGVLEQNVMLRRDLKRRAQCQSGSDLAFNASPART